MHLSSSIEFDWNSQMNVQQSLVCEDSELLEKPHQHNPPLSKAQGHTFLIKKWLISVFQLNKNLHLGKLDNLLIVKF